MADCYKSHPARGAWIEIRAPLRCRLPPAVAPRKGCVEGIRICSGEKRLYVRSAPPKDKAGKGAVYNDAWNVRSALRAGHTDRDALKMW